MTPKKIKGAILACLILLLGLHAILNYQNEILSFIYRDKIWAHRVNSLEKYKEAHEKFPGVEVDIIFNKDLNNFDITHPPIPSIGLTLEEYFGYKEINDERGFWLDFKNLDKNNFKEASDKLSSLVESLGMDKSIVIVESTNSEFLPEFSNKGFKTSFYLPRGLYKLDKDELKNKISMIKSKMQLAPTNYISANANNYIVMKDNFPNKKILTWFALSDPPKINSLYRFKRAFIKFYHKYKLMSDENVVISLSKFEAKEGNR